MQSYGKSLERRKFLRMGMVGGIPIIFMRCLKPHPRNISGAGSPPRLKPVILGHPDGQLLEIVRRYGAEFGKIPGGF